MTHDIRQELRTMAAGIGEKALNISDIKWDTEQEDGSYPRASDLGLPKGAYAILDIEGLESDEVEELVSDYLSDNYNYCVISFSYTVL